MERTDVFHWVVVLVLGVFAALAGLFAYYALVASSGGGGNAVTDIVGGLLVREHAAQAVLGTVIAAVSGFVLSLGTDGTKGTTTARGWIYFVLLSIVFGLSLVGAIALEPDQVDLGTAGTPQMVDNAANALATYSLTLLSGLLGLGKLGGKVLGRAT